MTLMEKLGVLADAAKYDASCASSGTDRPGTAPMGICHSWADDGRCISLLKVLMSNACSYNCAYCVNRRDSDAPRATFTPRELAELTIGFYRRNYIEGLFLSSAVLGSADATMERMVEALRLLREEYGFRGYIHVKTIPGCSQGLMDAAGLLADRVSINIELPSQASLQRLAPDKSRHDILSPMGYLTGRIAQSQEERLALRHAPRFAPAGQSTQMIVGATGESDRQILLLTQGLYQKYRLKRVYYSAYTPVPGASSLLPALREPPLLREHRLYQCDFLLRFYSFTAEELLSAEQPNLDPAVDPKACWALRHLEQFPVEVNRADYETLLRVPGIGVKSAQRILAARRHASLRPEHLKKLGVVMKRAAYFLTCQGRAAAPEVSLGQLYLAMQRGQRLPQTPGEQLSLLPPTLPPGYEGFQEAISWRSTSPTAALRGS